MSKQEHMLTLEAAFAKAKNSLDTMQIPVKTKTGFVITEKDFPMKLTELCGWVGMALVQSATLPTTIKLIMGLTTAKPPANMVLLVWFGLACYFIRAYAERDKLYMFSNGFGFFVNTILLGIIVYA